MGDEMALSVDCWSRPRTTLTGLRLLLIYYQTAQLCQWAIFSQGQLAILKANPFISLSKLDLISRKYRASTWERPSNSTQEI